MKRRDEILVGLLLIVAIVVGIGGTIWIARGGLSQNYAMYMRLPWGAGLKQGQVVLLAGVQVGFVDQVELDPNGTLKVTLKIQDKYSIPTGSTAAVEANGIFGDQLIAIRPQIGVKTYMARGDSIPAGASTPGMNELLTKGDSIALDVRAITAKARTELVEGGGVDDIRNTVAALTKLVAQLTAVATEQSRQLTITQQTLRNTLASIDSSKVDSTVVNVRAASASLEQLSRELRATNVQFQDVITKVSNGNGTTGRMISDDQVYRRLDLLLLRADSLMADIKANPRKYINLRIF